MVASDIKYEIHSLHINVGNGDGAIHLLVEPGADKNPNVVHRAILVDGGKTTALDQIQKTIQYIEDTYKIVDTDGSEQRDPTVATKPPFQLRFDGIVVTRWAVDHSAGVLALINKQLLADQPDPTIPRMAADGKTKLGPCSFMRYDKTNLAPLTNFYSAFWDGPTGASLVASAPQKSSTQPPPTSQIRITPTATQGTDVPPPSPPFNAGDSKRTVDFIDSSNKAKIWAKFCNLVATPTELIGRELFTGQIATQDKPAVRTYEKLSDMTNALQPFPYLTGTCLTGICCIGADGIVVSKDPPVEPEKQPDILKTSSINLVAVVGDVIQHYFAGDADCRDGRFKLSYGFTRILDCIS